MRKSLFSLICLFIVLMIFLSACSSKPAATTTRGTQTPPAATQTSTIPPTTPPPAPLHTNTLTDTTDDIFNADGIQVFGEPYLDIVSVELTEFTDYYIATIKVNGNLPEKAADPSFFYEWDILVDTSNGSLTGLINPLITNDIRVTYMFRLTLEDTTYYAEYYNVASEQWGALGYVIKDDTIRLQFNKMQDIPEAFKYIVNARKYGSRGNPDYLLAVDKMPNTEHATFVVNK